MATFRKSAIVLGVTMSAIFASNAFAIGSKADCEYEGGETFNINGDLICVIPVREEAFHGEEYDGMQLGVKDCEGDVIADGVFCRMTLIKAPKKTPAETGVGLKAGDIVNEKGEKVMDASKATEMAKDAKKAAKDAAN